MLILVPEWRITDQEDVKNDTARPDVDWLAVWFFLEYFRAEVTGRPGETLTKIISGHSREKFYLYFALKYRMRQLTRFCVFIRFLYLNN